MASPVRVLHIIDDLLGGGAQQFVWDIVRLADPAEVQHQVVSLMVDRGEFVYADRLTAAGVYRPTLLASIARRASQPVWLATTSPRPSLTRNVFALGWRMVRFMRTVVGLAAKVAAFRPHVIHAHLMHSLPAALTLKKAFRLPVVYTVPCLLSQMHDIGADWLADIYRERHDEVDLFFVGLSMQELRGLGIPEQKLRPLFRVPGDLSAAFAATARREEYRSAVRAGIGADPDCPVVLSAGRLHRSKGHDYALEAMPAILQACPEAHWILLGIGEEQSSLAKRARELGLESRVHLLGYHENPLPYYAAADVFLRANIFEGESGCSYLAMAAAVPVVGFDTGCENELIATVGHGFLVPNRDSAALAARTIEILSSLGKSQELGKRGESYARDHLDVAPAVRDLVDTYRALRAARG